MDVMTLSGHKLDYAVGVIVVENAWDNWHEVQEKTETYRSFYHFSVKDEYRNSIPVWDDEYGDEFIPVTRWDHAGPIIEREHIEIFFSGTWKAAIKTRKKKTLPNGFQIETDWHKVTSGETPLIAAMRCFVASKQA